jgi:hypothetical protein
MTVLNYTGKYIEILKPLIIHSKEDCRFLIRIRDQIRKDPKRRAFIRKCIAKPGYYTVYANIPFSYDTLGYKVFYDEKEIVRC